MNREILFRGKRLDSGEWVYGDLLHGSSTRIGRLTAPKQYPLAEVDPDTVGQYTGLTDKNGTKIFEGDMVNTCWDGVNDEPGIVRFRDAAYQVDLVADEKNGQYLDFYHDIDSQLEVIGNIHDNPELMKGGKQ